MPFTCSEPYHAGRSVYVDLHSDGNIDGGAGAHTLVSSNQTLYLKGGNNVTLGQTVTNGSNIINIEGGAGGGGGNVNWSGSNGSFNSSAVKFANSNGISFFTAAPNQIAASYSVPVVGSGIEAVNISNYNGAESSQFAAIGHIHQGVHGIYVEGDATSYFCDVDLAAGNNMSLATGGVSSLGTINFVNLLSSGTNIQPVGTANAAGVSASLFAKVDHVHRGVAGIVVDGTASTFYGNFVLAAGNNITLSTGGVSTAGSISIHGAAGGLGAAIVGVQDGAGSVLTTGTIEFANANNMTFGLGAGASSSRMTASFSLSVPVVSNAIQSVGTATGSGTNTSRFAADDHVHAGVPVAGISGGNVSGETGARYGSIMWAGGNNITLSGATAAGGQTITISAFNQTAPVVSNAIQSVGIATGSGTNTSRFAADDHVHAGVPVAGISGGNVAGETGVKYGSVAFAGGNNITLSGVTAAGGQTITISAFNQTAPVVSNAIQSVGIATASGTNTSRFAADDHVHAGVPVAGISGGNVAGETGTRYGSIAFAGGNFVTLSGATAAGGQTITVSAALPGMHFFENMPGAGLSNAGALSVGSWYFQYAYLPGALTLGNCHLMVVVSSAAAQSSVKNISISVGLYTDAGANVLSLLRSCSMSSTVASVNTRSHWLEATTWDATSVLTPGNYYVGVGYSFGNTDSSINSQVSMVGRMAGILANAPIASMMPCGNWTTTSASPPASVAMSDLVASAASRYRIPYLIINGRYSGSGGTATGFP